MEAAPIEHAGRVFIRAVAAVAALKVVAAIPCVFLVPPTTGPATPSRWFLLALLVVLSSGAAYLAAGGGRDRRAGLLALCLILSASAFADGFLTRAAAAAPALAGFGRALVALQCAAFLPYATWAFFGAFPQAPPFGPVAQLATRARRLTAGIGAALFVANLVLLVPGPRVGGGSWRRVVELVGNDQPGSAFWPLVLALTALALGFGIRNARHAALEERRRVRLLIAGVVVGGAPIVALELVTQLWPLAHRVITEPPVYAVAQWIVYCPLLAVPLVTAYAVHVHHALDVRLYVRRALQYALARGTVLVLAALPFVALAFLIYEARDRRVAELLTGGRGALLLGAGVGGLVIARGRRRVLDAVDRRFFREQYDARVILRDLVDGIRRVTAVGELERLVTQEVERALHPESVALLVVNLRGEHLVSRTGAARPLPLSAGLATFARERAEPVSIDLDDSLDSGPGTLPEADRAWLADGGFHLLVPLLDGANALIGLLALGAKRSELPFSPEDRSLLAAVGSATAVALERRLLADQHTGERVASQAAGECTRCGLIAGNEEPVCARCGGPVQDAAVPRLLAGKFQVQERIGAGGMGVVYLARDLSLERPVAIKTLQPMGALLAWRLRREARAMAAVTHPNLAAIYGLESWNGTPLLVVEYLPGGTLSSRIAQGRLSLDETLELGAVLLDAADCVHRAGILHRDIKPSNIGFTAAGAAKLLDFGLARIMDTARAEGVVPRRTPVVLVAAGSTAAEAGVTATDTVLGTPEYMSPEAVAGEPPDPSFDLWSIAVVLYESLAGRPPFAGFSPKETLHLVRTGRAPDLCNLVPACPAPVTRFFRDALAPLRSGRPPNAAAMKRRLLELRGG